MLNKIKNNSRNIQIPCYHSYIISIRDLPYFKRTEFLKIAHFQQELFKLRKSEVYDVNYQKLGTIVDFIFDDKYELTHLVVAESKIARYSTRLLQALRIIRRNVGNVYYIDAKELKKEENEDNPELSIYVVSYKNAMLADQYTPEGVLFSNLKNRQVFGSEGNKLGRIIDAIIHIDFNVSFILGGSYMEEFLEDVGAIANLDIFLPANIITHRDDKGDFHLKYPRNMFQKKASRPDIIRGVQFDRFPGEKHHIFYKMRTSLSDFESNTAFIPDKIKSSQFASQIELKNLEDSQDEIFITLHDSVFFTSPDPVRGLTKKEVKLYENERTFIAWYNGQAIGFIYLPIFLNREGDLEGSIAGVGVISKHRGKRVALLLLDHAQKYFRKHEVQSVTCEVFERNEPSRAMFEGLGFEIYDHMELGKK